MRILADAANVDLYDLRWPECLDKCHQAIELTRQADDSHAEVLARSTAVIAHYALGDLGGLRLHSAALHAPAERLRDRYWLATALWANESVSRLEGDWLTARDLSNQGLGLAPLEPRNLVSRALLEYEVGDFHQGDIYLERLLEVMRLTPHIFPAMVIPLAVAILFVITTVVRTYSDEPPARQRADLIRNDGYATVGLDRFQDGHRLEDTNVSPSTEMTSRRQ